MSMSRENTIYNQRVRKASKFNFFYLFTFKINQISDDKILIKV